LRAEYTAILKYFSSSQTIRYFLTATTNVVSSRTWCGISSFSKILRS